MLTDCLWHQDQPHSTLHGLLPFLTHPSSSVTFTICNQHIYVKPCRRIPCRRIHEQLHLIQNFNIIRATSYELTLTEKALLCARGTPPNNVCNGGIPWKTLDLINTLYEEWYVTYRCRRPHTLLLLRTRNLHVLLILDGTCYAPI